MEEKARFCFEREFIIDFGSEVGGIYRFILSKIVFRNIHKENFSECSRRTRSGMQSVDYEQSYVFLKPLAWTDRKLIRAPEQEFIWN